ncbi:MAG: peptidoglycan DD-metalloendopeptidase family protein [Actinomycetota bacterium]
MKYLAVVAVFALGVIAAPALADVTQGDLDEAREQVRLVTEQLADKVATYDAAVAQEAALVDRLDRLVVDLTARERDLVQARRSARDRAAEMYMTAGSSTPPAGTAEDMEHLPTRYVYLESVSQTDREVVNRLEFARREYEQQRALVEASLAEQESVRGEMEDLVTYIYGELEATNSEYQAIRTEWEAQEVERLRLEQEARDLREFLATSTTTTTRPVTTTTRPVGTTTTRPGTTTTTLPGTTTTTLVGASTTVTEPTTTTTFPPTPSGTRVCPVDGATSFSNSWGAPRSGGRTHKGTDMLAAEGTPLVAIESGVILSPGWHSEGGLGLYIRTDSGDTWYYAHLNSFVSGLIAGLRVEAGQRVGYVGHTGNASTPHLHIGWQPGGGAYQNPFPVVDGLC